MRRGAYGYPVLSASECRAMDGAAEAYGLPTAALMENAGRLVADLAGGFEGKAVLVAAGSGNNGGDALVAARILMARGRKVTVGLMQPLSALDGLCALNARRFLDADGTLADASGLDWSRAGLIIDGLLGTGITGEPREPVASVIRSINASGAPVLSIDVPSGIDSDSGAAPSLAVRASATVALGCYKPVLVHYPAAEWAGDDVVLADIGMPDSLYPDAAVQVLSGAVVREMLPVWSRDSHKGKRGSLLVVAGSRGMTGAAAMACNAAVNAGAGLVYLACPEPLVPVMERKLTEAMVRSVPSGGRPRFMPASLDSVLELAAKVDAVVLGPGLSTHESVSGFVAELLPSIACPILLDADALNIVSADGLKLPDRSIITPHPGEMARLLGGTVAGVQADRVRSARAAASRYRTVALLKGAHTVVCAADGPTVVNTLSDNVLATGGSGDVLSGVIGALLAQGLTSMAAAVVGARWHGTMGVLAASKLGGTVGASTMLKLLPRAREEMLNEDELEVLA